MNISRILIAFILVIGTQSLAYSQVLESGTTPEERAAILTEKMTTKLSLNETQVGQVAELNLGVAQKNEAIKNDTNMSQELKLASIQGNNDTRRAYFKLILSEEQYNQYIEMEESVKEVKKGKRKMKIEKESIKQEKKD
jgi:hypothetical protein